MNPSEGTLICVAGARGGAGASCLAAALAAAQLRARRQAVLVDLDFGGGGLDVLLGIEREPGARWQDLVAARGEVDGRGLLGALPHWDDVPVISDARLAAVPPSDDVVLDVCAGLLRANQQVVVDVPRPSGWTPAAKALLTDADHVVVVAPLTMAGSAGAQALVAAVRRANPRPSRGPRLSLAAVRVPHGQILPDDLAHLVELDLVATVRYDRRLGPAIEQGLGPQVGRRSRLGRAASELCAAFGDRQ